MPLLANQGVRETQRRTMNKVRKIAFYTLSLGYFAVALGYAAYAALSGTGLYRIMADWQLSVYAFYSGVLIFALLFAALTAPGIALMSVLGRWLMPAEREAALAKRRSRQLSFLSEKPGSPSRPIIRVIAARPRLAAFAGLALLIGGVALGYAMAAKNREQMAFQDIDLSKNEQVSADYVRVTGIARTNLAIEFEITRRSGTTIETYVPITGRNWRRDQPLAYFVKVTQKDLWLETSEQKTAFPLEAPPSLVTLPTFVRHNDLPRRVAAAFLDANLSLADEPIVLDSELHPAATMLQDVAFIMSIVGLFLFAMGLLIDAALRQSAQRAQPTSRITT